MTPTKFDVLILGSGTSSQVPVISCLVAKKPKKGCACCLSTMLPDGSGRKNMRRNTSAIVQFQSKNQVPNRPSTVLIDVGKSFCEAAREHFPKHGLDQIDAVLLTHPHADAINGLDDLRAWTLDAVIQATIPIYCTQGTFDEVAKIFPYMVNAFGGTGGGDVPAFEWHIITSDVPFDLFGVQISPLKVHHGCYFNSSGHASHPYECLAFLFDQTLCYMSDVSSIPDSTWTALGYPASGSRHTSRRSTCKNFEENCYDSDDLISISDASSKSSSAFSSSTSISSCQSVDSGLPLLIVDTLRLEPHISHFGIAEAVETAVKLRANRTYLLGFTHGVTHTCWEAACELISLASSEKYPQVSSERETEDSSELGNDPQRFAQVALDLVKDIVKNENLWIRPAFDGLRITTDGEKTTDNSHF